MYTAAGILCFNKEVYYHLKVSCNRLMMYIVNPKTTTKKIKQGNIVGKTILQRKGNHKND